MRVARVLCLGSLCAVAAGCGGKVELGPQHTAVFGPHGGVSVALPDGQGVCEVVMENDLSLKKGVPPHLAAYFLQKDLKTPIGEAPRTVSVKLMDPAGNSADFTLVPEPVTKDPSGTNRFASQAIPNPTDPLIGELTLSLGGKNATLPFSSR